MEAGRSIPPTHYFKLSSGELKACSFTYLLEHPRFKASHLGHQQGGILIFSAYALTHSWDCWIMSGIGWGVHKSLTVVGPANEAAPIIGLAPLVVVELSWLATCFA